MSTKNRLQSTKQTLVVSYVRSISEKSRYKQKTTILNFCKDKNYKVSEEFIDECDSVLYPRKTLKDMFKYLKTNEKVIFVVVTSISKFTRCNKIFRKIKDKLILRNVEIVSIEEPDYNIDSNILLVKYKNSHNKKYPFGFKWQDTKIVADETEAMLIRKIFRLYILYKDINVVKKILKEDKDKKRGDSFTNLDLQNILTNSKYIQNIVDLEMYNKVQEIKNF